MDPPWLSSGLLFRFSISFAASLARKLTDDDFKAVAAFVNQ